MVADGPLGVGRPRAQRDLRATPRGADLRAHPVRRRARLGQVVEWEPPHRLAYLWHLRQDRADATHVEISFAPAAGGTAVTIVHSGWERLGAKGDDLRGRNRRGWGGLLPHFEAFVRDEQG